MPVIEKLLSLGRFIFISKGTDFFWFLTPAPPRDSSITTPFLLCWSVGLQIQQMGGSQQLSGKCTMPYMCERMHTLPATWEDS